MNIVDNSISFPHPDTTHENGVLAIGGDLSPERLLLAYQYGIFPWYNVGEPVVWWHPDPRFVLYPSEVKVDKSMRSYFNQEKYRVTFDKDFKKVVTQCRKTKRSDGLGTWISEDILMAYTDLHELGYAHSVEVWDGDDLVGGLYGVSLGKIFYGESMFSKSNNSSKVALITLARLLERRGYFLIDCQIANPHLERMGGRFISRTDFMADLRNNIFHDTWQGSWSELGDGLRLKSIL